MQKIDYSEFAPSFSCYTSNSLTSKAVSKVIHEETAARSHEIFDDFEFSLALIDEEVVEKDIDVVSTSSLTRSVVLVNDGMNSRSTSSSLTRSVVLVNDDDIDSRSTSSSLTRSVVLVNDDMDSRSTSSLLTRSVVLVNDDMDSQYKSSSLTRTTRTTRTLLVNDEIDREIISLSSCSSSEADESESARSGAYCAWTKAVVTKCEKSKSTGSGTGLKKWRLRYLLRRSNSECKEPMMVLNPKKADGPKPHKRNLVGKAQSPVHEQFYVKKRAENEVGKRRSYLPYRTDLVGLFANVNGVGKMLPF